MAKNYVKWILINGEVRLSHAIYHRFLLLGDETTCDGGGMVRIEQENRRVVFYGESDDFGKADKEKFMEAVKNHREDIDCDLYFCFVIDTERFEYIFE